MKTEMKIITVVCTALMILPLTAAYAGPEDLPNTFEEVIPPFRGEGAFVEGAARTGGVIVGGASAIAVGIPLGLTGMFIGIPFGSEESAYLGAAGFWTPAMTGGALGQAALGGIAYVPKKVCYDAPKKMLQHLSAH